MSFVSIEKTRDSKGVRVSNLGEGCKCNW